MRHGPDRTLLNYRLLAVGGAHPGSRIRRRSRSINSATFANFTNLTR
jgi:hypothetical protein